MAATGLAEVTTPAQRGLQVRGTLACCAVIEVELLCCCCAQYHTR
jgi:hypothetical protein